MAEEREAVEGFEEALVVLAELAKDMDSAKSVSLMIRNTSNTNLVQPTAFPTSGIVFKIPPNTIQPGSSSTLGFHRTPIGLCGTEGVVVYQIADQNLSLCIFYSVPLVGRNGFLMRWYSNAAANEDLSNDMGNNKWVIADQIGWHDVHTNGFRATGCMTQGDDAKIIVQVSNRN